MRDTMTATKEQTADEQVISSALVTADGYKLSDPYPIPSDDAFEGDEFAPAYNLEKIAQELIAAHERFYFVKVARVRYLWKRKGGMSGGSVTMGATVRNSPMVVYDTRYDFTIWFAADVCKIANLTRQQAYALMYHELRHLKYDLDKGKVTVQGHEFEGFPDEIEHFGFWRPNVEAVAYAVQLRLEVDGPVAAREPVASPLPLTPDDAEPDSAPEVDEQQDDDNVLDGVAVELSAPPAEVDDAPEPHGGTVDTTGPAAAEPGIDEACYYDPALDKQA